MTAEMTPDAAKKLREKFPPSAVGKLPKGGVMLDYVGHAAVTDRLLAIDPLWSWEPLALDEHGLPALDSAKNLWIKLTVCGVTRIGVGDGPSAKVAIGDAIRNAAMRFGVALDLWSKEELEGSADARPARDAEPMPASQDVTDGPYGHVGLAGAHDPKHSAWSYISKRTPELSPGERTAVIVKALAPRDVGTATATDADWLWLLETWKRDGINLDKAAA